MKRNVLTVFLASPGDLEPERKIAREVVERINKVISRRVDWHIELLGWEDTLPGYSRPQDMINKDVDCCNLFLGLLWKRLGQSTGKYTSGFHEEFLRARERHTSSSVPEIWLFFKTVDNDSLEDPGEQLKKVLEFKKDQIERKELFFKEFLDASSWERAIYDQLLAYVLDLVQKSQGSGPDKAIPTGKETGEEISISAEEKQEGDDSFPPELGLILQKTSSHINGQKGAELDSWDKTRLFLLANAWFSSVHLDERLGVHEINLVYSQRKSWELSGEELSFIFRTIATDEYHTCPGWYWFQGEEEKLVDKGVYWLAFTAKDAEVRKMAFTLMTQTDYRPPKKIIEKGLSENKNEIVLKVIELLAQNGLPEDIGLLDKVIDSDESKIKNSAKSARLDLIYREKPNDAFREYMKIGGNRPIFLDIASKEMNLSVDKDVLLESLQSSHTEVRRFTTGYLRTLKELDCETAKGLLGDTDPEVRRQALWALVELDEKITVGQIRKLFPQQKATRSPGFGLLGSIIGQDYSAQSIYNEFFLPILKQMSPEEILTSLDTYNSDNEVAYRYLCVNHYELIESRIRPDLDSEFAPLISELEQKGWEKSTVDFVKAKMIQAALAGLAKHGNESDVKYARKFISNTHLNVADPEAVKLLVKYGDTSDIQKILEVSLTSGTETTRLAFEGALRLADDKIAVLEIILKEGDGKTAVEAAAELWVLDQDRVRKISRTMLSAESSYKRLKGLCRSD